MKSVSMPMSNAPGRFEVAGSLTIIQNYLCRSMGNRDLGLSPAEGEALGAEGRRVKAQNKLTHRYFM